MKGIIIAQNESHVYFSDFSDNWVELDYDM